MAGSALELKRLVSPVAYQRLKPQFSRKDWEIIAFSADYVVLRIERENIRFHREKGTIQERVALGPPKTHGSR